MASLFEIGKTGVQAYRQALSVTGQNIANINTDGYNKRRADVSEVAGVTGGPTNVSDQSGLGVRVTNVRRSFDAYLADKTRTSQSDYEMLNDFVSKLNDLENMLLPSGSDLGVFIGRFFDTLQDVASNPDSVSARAVALEAGKALSSSFNNYDEQFKNFKSNSLSQIDIKLTEANLYIDQIVEVNKLLNRYWSINGKVIKGQRRGRKIGFPTCNLKLSDYVVPKLGVYAVKVKSKNFHKNWIANIGYRPTFKGQNLLLETNIFGINENLYNKVISVNFKRFIRSEKKFRNLNYLKKQIKLDINKAKK